MAARRTHWRREAQLAFEALSIEGSLLSPEWLARVGALGAGGQSEAEYRVPRGLNLRDEIGRYWRIAQAHWNDFSAGRAGGADAHALSERFVTAFLRDVLGFVSLASTAPVEIAGRSYPIGQLALGRRAPVVIAPAASGLETSSVVFGDGTRRRSAFGLAQEFLNASDDALWGLACDGVTLRILRDNASLTRPAWIEADIARIFTEERYADFAALWLLAHETRFGSADKPPTDCALETWRNAGREEGTRALGKLRDGVQDALLALGQGFLFHADNDALRAALQDGSFTKEAYFQELLRLVYRVIFLLTVEERGVLHPDSASDAARALYAAGYSLHRLRDRAVRRSAHDRFSDLWEALTIVFRGTARGEARLGLPALAGLFAEPQCAMLEALRLENRALLTAMFHLTWLREGTGLSRVNWRDMGPEELGSVYEGLLEIVPQITEGGRRFAFATGGETEGNARKLTGSYYTPDSLVQVLLDSALEPVVQSTIAANPANPVDALLALAVVDPACGSGHFLLAAARRIAAHVAKIRANGTPSAPEYRHALREVVGHCIYGVDLNEMAVELCKVSLWMEAVEPGRPLSFLDSHIQHGNALLGATPDLMAKGVPDDAWEPIEGDDSKIARALKKQNKRERAELSLEFAPSPASTYVRLGAGARAVDEAADENLAALESKGRSWQDLVASPAYTNARFAADLWCAAFVWYKVPGLLRELAPTEAAFRSAQKDPARVAPELRIEVDRLRHAYEFFHWHLGFPQVFARGGFDVVLGNPPWGHIEIRAKEHFADLDASVVDARTDAERHRLISKLAEVEPDVARGYAPAVRKTHGTNQWLRVSGAYPLSAIGRINTYSVFAERALILAGERGHIGMILPSGLATDATTQQLFGSLMSTRRLCSFWEFENEGFFSAGQGHMLRFALVHICGAHADAAADFLFQGHALSELKDADRHFSLTNADRELLNPNTGACPIFQTRRDAEIAKAIYRRVPVLVRDSALGDDPWAPSIRQNMFSMSTSSGLFVSRGALLEAGWQLRGNVFERDAGRMLPLYEAKMMNSFTHRFGDYGRQADVRAHRLPEPSEHELARPEFTVSPCYWVPVDEVGSRIGGRWGASWLCCYRDVTDARASARTVIASIIPQSGTTDSLTVVLPNRGPAWMLPAIMNSFVLDFVARQKVGGLHLRAHVLKQLPILPPATLAEAPPWLLDQSLTEWMRPRVLELIYTAWDLEPFAVDMGYDGPAFRWDPERRFALRCELDAAFFNVYGLSREDAAYVMDTFPIVRRNDERSQGEYRTKRVILDVYDAMVEAGRTSKPYQTSLHPPPADPLAAHEPRAAEAGALGPRH